MKEMQCLRDKFGAQIPFAYRIRSQIQPWPFFFFPLLITNSEVTFFLHKIYKYVSQDYPFTVFKNSIIFMCMSVFQNLRM